MPAIAACGVELCIEPLAPAETDFVNTCAEGEELVQRVGHPAFRLHLDVKAMASEGTPVPELIRRHAGGAGHFHANDPNRRGPGFGACDFVPIFAALRDAGYRGWVSVEVFDAAPDPETVATRSLAYLRACAERAGG
jgi:sugar phosphate isomerase/epimerase